MSYFAKPKFIIYDEWFDNHIEKKKLDIKNKKIKTISNIHEYYYEQSNYKVGASENNLQLHIKENKKEKNTKNFIENPSEKFTSISNKEFRFFEKFSNSKIKFNIKKVLIYNLLIFGLVFIFGILIFFISQPKKNESNIFLNLEKEFLLSKGDH